jgi:hypothetical protein
MASQNGHYWVFWANARVRKGFALEDINQKTVLDDTFIKYKSVSTEIKHIFYVGIGEL